VQLLLDLPSEGIGNREVRLVSREVPPRRSVYDAVGIFSDVLRQGDFVAGRACGDVEERRAP
jgi:hypothetical protein